MAHYVFQFQKILIFLNFVKLQHYWINFLTLLEATGIEVTEEAILEMETLLSFIEPEAITAWTYPVDAAVTMLSELPQGLCNDGCLAVSMHLKKGWKIKMLWSFASFENISTVGQKILKVLKVQDKKKLVKWNESISRNFFWYFPFSESKF